MRNYFNVLMMRVLLGGLGYQTGEWNIPTAWHTGSYVIHSCSKILLYCRIFAVHSLDTLTLPYGMVWYGMIVSYHKKWDVVFSDAFSCFLIRNGTISYDTARYGIIPYMTAYYLHKVLLHCRIDEISCCNKLFHISLHESIAKRNTP